MASGTTSAGSWLKGVMLHDQVGINRTADNLRSSSTNIAHVRRTAPRSLQQHTHLITHVPDRATIATVRPSRPEDAAELLVQGIDQPELQHAIYDDVISISSAIFGALELPDLRAKLEIITRQSCPRWHADTVSIRCLCTYEGAGTLYVPNRAVKRKWNLDGTVAVLSVDESAAEQVEPWDLLYLKGNGFPELYGMGAVHKSPPEASPELPRLLLTLDDVHDCSCCSHPS